MMFCSNFDLLLAALKRTFKKMVPGIWVLYLLLSISPCVRLAIVKGSMCSMHLLTLLWYESIVWSQNLSQC